jgi:hypothetical protein
LKENLLSIQKTTEDFHLELKVCRECPFQTESTLTLEHHMEKIHRILDHDLHQDLLNLKNLDFYRCNICYYQTKNPSEMMKHIQEEMAKLGGKSQKGSSPYTAPQFLFDDRLKGELFYFLVGQGVYDTYEKYLHERYVTKPLVPGYI